MELFIINTYLSLLIFNPLEAAVLFLAATGDFKLVFSRKFIKHWFILGTINFVFQYLASCLDIGFAKLFVNHINSIVLAAVILYIYLKYILKIFKPKFKVLTVALYNAITIIFILIFFENIISYNFNIYDEIIVNFIIKVLQFLLLYIFFKGVKKYEKFCKKFNVQKC